MALLISQKDEAVGDSIQPQLSAEMWRQRFLHVLGAGVAQRIAGQAFADGLRQCGNIYCNSLADVGGGRQKGIVELILSVAGQSYGKQQTAEY